MHEEYRPGYHWDDLAEKKLEKKIPWEEPEKLNNTSKSDRNNTDAKAKRSVGDADLRHS